MKSQYYFLPKRVKWNKQVIMIVYYLLSTNFRKNKRMKTNAKKVQFLMLTLVMALILLPFNMNAQGSKTDFTGNWVLNAEKSNMGDAQGQGGMRMGGGNFVAKQEANLLTVDRTRQNQNGESMTTTSKYTLDGKESVNSTGRGESKSVATWSPDNKSLTIKTAMTFNMGGDSRTMNTTEVWSMNGSNLTVKTTREMPDGERTTTAVYDKK